MPQGIGYGMAEQIDGDPFPNMVRDRDQLSRLWTHIAQVLSDNVRQRSMGEEEPQQGLPAMGGGVQDSWQRAMEQEQSESGFRRESQVSQGEIGPIEMSSQVKQLGDPGAGRSGRMTAEEVAQVAFNAGFRGDDLAIMVAIGMSESSSDPTAHNPNRSTGDNSYGIWQINMIETYQAERLRRFGLQANEELWDPDVNARAAYQLYQGRMSRNDDPFVDWSDYKNGRYLRYWDVASKAAAQTEGVR